MDTAGNMVVDLWNFFQTKQARECVSVNSCAMTHDTGHQLKYTKKINEGRLGTASENQVFHTHKNCGMNMFKPSKTKTVKDYLAAVPSERKEIMHFLHDFICKTAPKLRPYFATNMLGYGSFACRNYKKEIINWPTIALANQKNYVSLYICAVTDGTYIAEKHKKELGKVAVGKSCIRIKKLGDINLPVLKKIIQLAEKNPGLVF